MNKPVTNVCPQITHAIPLLCRACRSLGEVTVSVPAYWLNFSIISNMKTYGAICAFILVSLTLVTACGSKKRCPATQEWTDCGSPCEPTCEDPYLRCDGLCVTDTCRCPSGMVKEYKGGDKCVSLEECQKGCPDTQVLISCKTPCDPTCGNHNDLICLESCMMNQCGCPKGKLLKEEGSTECVFEVECP